MKQGYRVWVETPEACVETLTTGTADKTESSKPPKTQVQPEQCEAKKEIPTELSRTDASDTNKIPQSDSVDSQSEMKSCEQKL